MYFRGIRAALERGHSRMGGRRTTLIEYTEKKACKCIVAGS